jgi:hypothetical protein
MHSEGDTVDIGRGARREASADDTTRSASKVGEVRDEALAWFQGYLDAVAAAANDPLEDPRRLLEFYAVPLVLSGDAGARVFATEADVITFVTDLTDSLRPLHYSHSETLDGDLVEVNRCTWLYRAEFSRRRTDGTEIERVGATYFIARGQSGLRIFAVAIHPQMLEEDPSQNVGA